MDTKIRAKKILLGLSVQNPVASIGLYVDCGSIYDTPVSLGATHLLERMAFKTTKNRSHLCIVREVEAVGGKWSAWSKLPLNFLNFLKIPPT